MATHRCRRVAVIGAGVSGLNAVKSCLEEGLDPVCLEKTEHVGGLWHYEDRAKEGCGSVMLTTITNGSKEAMAYSNFPIPAETPNFMHHSKVLAYLLATAAKFDLLRHIRYSCEVVAIKKHEDYAQSGQWEVIYKDLKAQEEVKEVFDAVMVCNGHHAVPRMPEFSGMTNFTGEQIHSHRYRNSAGFEGKRVVVVGLSNTGGDVSAELAQVCDQVYLSTRKGAWVFKRTDSGASPTDLSFHRRFVYWFNGLLPSWLLNWKLKRRLNAQINHSWYGFLPQHPVTAQHGTVNDDLPIRISAGQVLVKSNIARLTNTRDVIFTDGSVAKNIDTVIYATGYQILFPFMEDIVPAHNNEVSLYKLCFPPDLPHPTLAVVGCIQPNGGAIPLTEMQCRWITRVFKGLCALPSPTEMHREIKVRRAAIQKQYCPDPRHTIQVDYMDYMDDIGKLIGCKPNLGRLLLADPLLAWHCIFGVCVPAQFRLHGPKPWPGARETILGIDSRVRAPTNAPPPSASAASFISVVCMAVGGGLLACALRYVCMNGSFKGQGF